MKPARLEASFRAQVRKLSKTEKRKVGQAIRQAQEVFGSPLVHSGASVRKLTRDYYEARADLHLRLVFKHLPDVLSFEFAGNHREGQTFLKAHK
ncbi:MAG: hypothetical protein HY735_31270 [Verrucomicrobia bacterium]|nr:hypothetical protein [Verrucomicrobiota bacterium]